MQMIKDSGMLSVFACLWAQQYKDVQLQPQGETNRDQKDHAGTVLVFYTFDHIYILLYTSVHRNLTKNNIHFLSYLFLSLPKYNTNSTFAESMLQCEKL